jgi:hypothetical protein
LVNGTAYALVNSDAPALLNGQAYALVNGEAYALVNGLAFALVNSNAYALVNASALTGFLKGLKADNPSNIILSSAEYSFLNSQNPIIGMNISLNPVTVVTGKTVSGSPHKILPGAFISPNFETTYSAGNLTVFPRNLNVRSEFDVSNSVSAVKYTYWDGFAPGENSGNLAAINYSLSPVGLYSYSLCPQITAPNYNIFSECTTYNNPFGPGTKKLRSYLNCVADNGDNTYTARFSWENNNPVPVVVPKGSDNYLSPADVVVGGNLPEYFPPGTGTFEIKFTGTKLTWTISSYDTDHKSSTTSGVSADSPKCTKSGIINAGNLIENNSQQKPIAYPNPTHEKVTVLFPSEVEGNDVMVNDMWGRSIYAKINQVSETSVEIDLSSYTPGLYIISARYNEKDVKLRIMKQ